jgi:hypothetical protein
MPLRRASNGGWERVSSAQLRQERDDGDHHHADDGINRNPGNALTSSSSSSQQSAATEAAAATVRTENNSNNSSYNWAASVGRLRVRQDQVQRKMHVLTGTAAVGGFLFGYDTGMCGDVCACRHQPCVCESKDEAHPVFSSHGSGGCYHCC